MSPNERQEFEQMKADLNRLKDAVDFRGNIIVLKKTVQVDGKLNADRVYTQRSGSYVELTS